MREVWERLWPEDEGQDPAEYALLLFMVGMIAITAMKGFASSVSNVYSRASESVVAATVSDSGGGRIFTGSPSIKTVFQDGNIHHDVVTRAVAEPVIKR